MFSTELPFRLHPQRPPGSIVCPLGTESLPWATAPWCSPSSTNLHQTVYYFTALMKKAHRKLKIAWANAVQTLSRGNLAVCTVCSSVSVCRWGGWGAEGRARLKSLPLFPVLNRLMVGIYWPFTMISPISCKAAQAQCFNLNGLLVCRCGLRLWNQ